MKNTLADHLNYLGHDIDFMPQVDCEPTSTWPGTRERVEIYRQRVVDGCAVFHPGDRTFEGAVGVVFRPDDGRPAPVRTGRPPKHSMPVTKFVNANRINRKAL